MKNSTVFQLITTYLLASTGRSFSLISSIRRELRSSKFQSPLFESPSETDSEDLFNENDDSLSGEPRWFNPAARNEISDSIRKTELIEDGVVLRALPIYMLGSDQCFPTGSLSLKVSDSYRVMMDDVKKTDKMFGVVMSDGKGQFCEVGTAVENVKQEILKGGNQKLENVCRQRFRILKIVQVEPYMIADVEYGFPDLDVLASEQGMIELNDNIIFLEKEIYQILCDAISLTNKLFEEENSVGVNRGGAVLDISDAVKLLSPQKHFFRSSVATDFSFAVSDMINASPRLKQLLLEDDNLESRLIKIKKLLVNSRSYLLNCIDAYDEPFN